MRRLIRPRYLTERVPELVVPSAGFRRERRFVHVGRSAAFSRRRETPNPFDGMQTPLGRSHRSESPLTTEEVVARAQDGLPAPR